MTARTLPSRAGRPGTANLTAPRPGRRNRYVRKAQHNATGYAFMIGAIGCFALFSWYPMIREVILSFQRTNFAGETTWVGLANYRHIIHDPSFWGAWRATALFAGLALIFRYAAPFLTAILLNELRHCRGYFRLLVYLPVMIPPAAAAVLWKWFFNNYGSAAALGIMLLIVLMGFAAAYLWLARRGEEG